MKNSLMYVGMREGRLRDCEDGEDIIEGLEHKTYLPCADGVKLCLPGFGETLHRGQLVGRPLLSWKLDVIITGEARHCRVRNMAAT